MITGIVASQMTRPKQNLQLNGNQFLSQPNDTVIASPSSMLIDFIPSALPPQTGGFPFVQALTYNATLSAPFLNLSPTDTDYAGMGMTRGAAPTQLISLLPWASLVVGIRYKIAVTIDGAGNVTAYVNGVQRYQGFDNPYRRPTSICGRSAAGANCLNGQFVQFAIVNAALSGAQVAAIAADDNYNLLNLSGISDLWVGSDIQSTTIANRVTGGPPLTLITKA